MQAFNVEKKKGPGLRIFVEGLKPRILIIMLMSISHVYHIESQLKDLFTVFLRKYTN